MYCADCKKELNIDDSDRKDWATTFLLSFFMGFFGIHRFYTGYIGIGIAQALTFGGFGLWSLIDWISISINRYMDYEGRKLEGYVKPLGIGAISVIFTFFTILLIFMAYVVFMSIKMVNSIIY